MTDRLEIKAQLAVTEAGEITGLAWPFGSADRVGDVIVKGAFAAPAALPMLFAHDQAQVIGVWDRITETEAGLTVKGRLLIDDVERAREVRAMVKAGAVSGLSIGFVTKDAKREGRGRRITALELHEISIVAVPAHPGAQITSLKSTHCNSEFTQMEQEDTAAQLPQIDTKAFDEIKARLDKLEAKTNRPSLAVTGVQSPIMAADEVKGFVHYLNRKTMASIRKLADLDGQLLWQSGLAAGQPSLLLGRPVYEAPDMDDATTGKTPIVFGDFASGYTIADHTGFSVMRDDYTGAANGIVKLHARRRVGGRVTLGEALVKLKLAA